jgi:hypothetical protein
VKFVLCSEDNRDYKLNIIGAFLNQLQKADVNVLVSGFLCAWNNGAPAGPVFVKFYIWDFTEICRHISILITLYTQTYGRCNICPLLVFVFETGCALGELRAEAEETVEHRASNMISCKR